MTGSLNQILAIITVAAFVGMFIFQLLMAFGVPIAYLSWGGKYEKKLPKNLRIASFVSSLSFIFGGICILERVKILTVLDQPILCRVIVWILALIFALSTIGNINSKSKAEKKIMTPISACLAILCLFIALTAN